MEKGTITLKWEKFDSFEKLLRGKNNKGIYNINYELPSRGKITNDGYWKRGVYLHTVCHKDEKNEKVEFVDYVGKVEKNNIIERQLEHYRNMISGQIASASEVIDFFDPYKHYIKNYTVEKNNEKIVLDFHAGLNKLEKKYENPEESKYFNIIFNKDEYLKFVPIFFEYAKNTKVYLGFLYQEDKIIEDVEKIRFVEKHLIEKLKPIRNLNRNENKDKNKYQVEYNGVIEIEVLEQNNKNFWKDREKAKNKIKEMGLIFGV